MTKAQAGILAMPEGDQDQAKTIGIETVSVWLKARFSEAELAEFRPEDLRVEAHYCSCSDQPRPHFPYSVVVFKTRKGDLVARPQAAESAVNITPLAVRHGNRYCELGSEERCYGSFVEICEFTDFRYGPYLKEFFPTCKADSTVSLSTATDEETDRHP
jgi:hypothetical protein